MVPPLSQPLKLAARTTCSASGAISLKVIRFLGAGAAGVGFSFFLGARATAIFSFPLPSSRRWDGLSRPCFNSPAGYYGSNAGCLEGDEGGSKGGAQRDSGKQKPRAQDGGGPWCFGWARSPDERRVHLFWDDQRRDGRAAH